MNNKFLFIFLIFYTFSFAQEKNYDLNLHHNVSGEAIYTALEVDIKPKLMYGENGMYRFMSRNFKFPKNEKFVQKIVCSFIVEVDGTITDIKVINEVPEDFTKEALRVMNKFEEPWYPAIKDNKQVRCQYILPILIDRI